MSARKPTIHLVCNSHIDPVWLWEWEEGVAVTLPPLRTAAGVWEGVKRFVFCPKEARLSQGGGGEETGRVAPGKRMG